MQVVDSAYRPVRTIRGGNGYRLDFHEATITPQGTLLGIVYNPVRRDLTAWGGPKEARVVDAVIQEIDIADHEMPGDAVITCTPSKSK